MKKRFGFSVLELLALLVTISIVTAALAPVFTKRVRSVNATANPSKVSQNCSNRFSAYCTSCNIRECLTCDRLMKQLEFQLARVILVLIFMQIVLLVQSDNAQNACRVIG